MQNVSGQVLDEHRTTLTPLLASAKNSRMSASTIGNWGAIRMKIVHGCRGGFPVFGVRAPVLPSTGDLTSSTSGVTGITSGSGVDTAAGVVFCDTETSGELVAPSAVRSLSFRSFFSFRFSLSFSAFSDAVDPLGFEGTGLALPVAGCSAAVAGGGGGVEVVDLFARWGGRGRSGTGVGPLVGG